jgi:hypothetical protein
VKADEARLRAGAIVRAWCAILGGSRPLSFTVRSHQMNSTVVSLSLVPAWLIAWSLSAAQSTISNAEAVRQIDWVNFYPGSPIPERIIATESDDPLEAGLPPQWIEASFIGLIGPDPWAVLALHI